MGLVTVKDDILSWKMLGLILSRGWHLWQMPGLIWSRRGHLFDEGIFFVSGTLPQLLDFKPCQLFETSSLSVTDVNRVRLLPQGSQLDFMLLLNVFSGVETNVVFDFVNDSNLAHSCCLCLCLPSVKFFEQFNYSAFMSYGGNLEIHSICEIFKRLE